MTNRNATITSTTLICCDLQLYMVATAAGKEPAYGVAARCV